jgi:transcriptional regulator with AAA-type ATPase domain
VHGILQQLLTAALTTRNTKSTSDVTNTAALDESARQAGCQEVVLSFAKHLGYVARECMSREELAQKIDAGIHPDDLADELHSRIDKIPGIILGAQSHLGHKIKLPYSYRDRHMYIVGRTGSGKTNFAGHISDREKLHVFRRYPQYGVAVAKGCR